MTNRKQSCRYFWILGFSIEQFTKFIAALGKKFKKKEINHSISDWPSWLQAYYVVQIQSILQILKNKYFSQFYC